MSDFDMINVITDTYGFSQTDKSNMWNYFRNETHEKCDDHVVPCLMTYQLHKDYMSFGSGCEAGFNKRFASEVSREGSTCTINVVCLLPLHDVIVNCLEDYTYYLIPYAMVNSCKTVEGMQKWFASLISAECLPCRLAVVSEMEEAIEGQCRFMDERYHSLLGIQSDDDYDDYDDEDVSKTTKLSCFDLIFDSEEQQGLYFMKVAEKTLSSNQRVRSVLRMSLTGGSVSQSRREEVNNTWDDGSPNAMLLRYVIHRSPRFAAWCNSKADIEGATAAQMAESPYIQTEIQNLLG